MHTTKTFLKYVVSHSFLMLIIAFQQINPKELKGFFSLCLLKLCCLSIKAIYGIFVTRGGFFPLPVALNYRDCFTFLTTAFMTMNRLNIFLT